MCFTISDIGGMDIGIDDDGDYFYIEGEASPS